MIENPLVSIIIPSYGGGDRLSRSIDSVISQTYRYIECIVVDDNGLGTENQIKTQAVMSSYSSNPSIKYICHKNNNNGSAARNTGFRNSRGDLICVLDDDDELLPDFVQIQVDAHKDLPNDYALTYVRASNVINGHEIPMDLFYPDDNVDMRTLFINNYGIFACSYMMKRNVFYESGGYDESFKRHQDMEFLERIISKYGKVRGINRICYRRYLTQRNNPRNPDIARKYREHYLEKMSPYFSILSKKDQKDIYDYHMMDVGILYLSSKDFLGFLKLYLRVLPGWAGNKRLIAKFWEIVKRGKLRSKDC